MKNQIILGKKITNGSEIILNGADRFRHLYIIGQTGTGKTTLLQNLILQDIHNNKGVGVIDPHGDMAREIIDCIPEKRLKDVIYINADDINFPIGFNPLYEVLPDDRPLVASNIIGAFKNIWQDSWGNRMQDILYNSVYALLEVPNTTLLCITKLIIDLKYRQTIIKKISDPKIRHFWIHEFGKDNTRFNIEKIAPIQNKINQFFSDFRLRNILGQVKNKIDFNSIKKKNKIIIINLSKGKLGSDKAGLLGSLFVAQFKDMTFKETDILQKHRKEFYLYIDEFQNFATNSFEELFSELRKYKLGLTVAHQYTAQLRDEIKSAVFGNVGSMVSFGVGGTDAEILKTEYGDFPSNTFRELNKFNICTKILKNGNKTESFLGETIPLLDAKRNSEKKIIKLSRQKFSVKREVIEKKINKWFQ